MITSGRAYNNIINELELVSDETERLKYKHIVDLLPTNCYCIIWEEYTDPSNGFELKFIIEAMFNALKNGVAN